MKRIACISTNDVLFAALLAAGTTALAACSGGGTAPVAQPGDSHPASGGAGSKTTAVTGATETVWVVDGDGTLGTGGVTAYAVSPTSTALTAIPSDAYNESRPNIDSNPAGVNAPQSLAFDASGNLWVASQLSGLIVALEPGSAGVAPVLLLPSGVKFPSGLNQTAIGFDASNNLWAGGPTKSSISWTYQAYSLGSNLSPTALTTTVPPDSGSGAYNVVPTALVFDHMGKLWTQGASTAGNPNGVQSYTLSGGTATLSTFIAAPNCIGSSYGPFTFDAAGDLWCVDPGGYTSPSIEEFSNPGGTMLASFPVPMPPNVNVSYSYTIASIRFDPGGTLWVLAAGSSPNGTGAGTDDYAGLIALGPTGQTLTMLTLPNDANDVFPDFIFQP